MGVGWLGLESRILLLFWCLKLWGRVGMILTTSPGIWARPSVLLGVEAWLECGGVGVLISSGTGQGFSSCSLLFFVRQNSVFLIPLNTGCPDSTGTEISVSHKRAQS